MVAIGFNQKLSNCVLYEHGCLEDIKKLYKTSGKCDDQQQHKAIIEAEIVSTPEVCTNKSMMTHNLSVNTKKPSTRK